MFGLFNISVHPKTQEIAVKKPVVLKKKAPSVKVDAMKILSNVLDELVNVNNSKVDTLRKLYVDISSGKINESELISFLKRDDSKPKKKKIKALISGQLTI